MTLNWIQLAATLSGVLIVGWAGYYALKSRLAKITHDELATLVDLRGKKIEDLEACIDELSRKVSVLEGQFNALQSLKSAEIAFEVARLLRSEGFVSRRKDTPAAFD